MKTLIIVLFIIIGCPKMSVAFTEDQCYFYNSLLNAAPLCLKERDSLGPSPEEITKLQKHIIIPCYKNYKDATAAAFFIGKKEIRDKASCDEIIDEYLHLFKNFGLTGNLIAPVPDDTDMLDDVFK